MKFVPTTLDGSWVLELELKTDDRGGFARAFCRRELEERGLEGEIAQINLSYNHRAGTIRGMHFQRPPAAETKLIRCIFGRIYDVIVDLRSESDTFGRAFGIELSAENRKALYVPERFAHGYQALTDGAEVLYSVTEFYAPGREGGFRHDDPAVGIDWPLPATVVSSKDASWPDFDQSLAL